MSQKSVRFRSPTIHNLHRMSLVFYFKYLLVFSFSNLAIYILQWECTIGDIKIAWHFELENRIECTWFNNDNVHDVHNAISTPIKILKLYLVWHTSFALTATISRDATFQTHFQICKFFPIKNAIFFTCMNNMHMKFCMIKCIDGLSMCWGTMIVKWKNFLMQQPVTNDSHK
jgi:hypothetical protein